MNGNGRLNKYRNEVLSDFKKIFPSHEDTDIALTRSFVALKEYMEYRRLHTWEEVFESTFGKAPVGVRKVTMDSLERTIGRYSAISFLRTVVPDFVTNTLHIQKICKGMSDDQILSRILELKQAIERKDTTAIASNLPLYSTITAYTYAPPQVQDHIYTRVTNWMKSLSESKNPLEEALFAYSYNGIRKHLPEDKQKVHALLRNSKQPLDSLDFLLIHERFNSPSTDAPIEAGLLFDQLLRQVQVRKFNEHILLYNTSFDLIKAALTSNDLMQVSMTIAVASGLARDLLERSKYLENRKELNVVPDNAPIMNTRAITAVVFGMKHKLNTTLASKIEFLNPRLSQDGHMLVLGTSQLIEKAYPGIEHQHQHISLQEVLLLPQKMDKPLSEYHKTVGLFTFLGSKSFPASLTMQRFEQMNLPRTTKSVLKRKEKLQVDANLVSSFGSFRHAMREQVKVNKRAFIKPRRTKSQLLYAFTEELPIRYALRTRSGKVVAIAAFLMPRKENNQYVLSKSNVARNYLGTEVGTTRIEREFVDKQTAIDWVHSQYPYATIRKQAYQAHSSAAGKQEQRCIQNEVRLRYIKIVQGKPVTLKTVWYLYHNSENSSKKDNGILAKLMASDIGSVDTNQATRTVLQQKCYAVQGSQLNKTQELLLLGLLETAVRNGHCFESVLDEFYAVKDSPPGRNRKREVSDFFKKRSLTSTECRNYFRAINVFDEKTVEKNEAVLNVCALLRLLTGLSSNAICALQWQDYQEISGYGRYRFSISKQLTNDGLHQKEFTSARSTRFVPVPYMLEDKVDWLKNRIPMDEDYSYWKDKPIFCRDDSYDKPITPKELDMHCDEKLSAIGIHERVIEVDTADSGTQEINFNRYRGDFFRSNYIHYAINKADIEEGDLDYLLGRKGWDTLSEHYVGFSNCAVQYNIAEVLNRWHASLEHPQGRMRVLKRGYNNVRSLVIEGESGVEAPESMRFAVNSRTDNTELKVSIESSHPVEVTLSEA